METFLISVVSKCQNLTFTTAKNFFLLSAIKFSRKMISMESEVENRRVSQEREYLYLRDFKREK